MLKYNIGGTAYFLQNSPGNLVHRGPVGVRPVQREVVKRIGSPMLWMLARLNIFPALGYCNKRRPTQRIWPHFSLIQSNDQPDWGRGRIYHAWWERGALSAVLFPSSPVCLMSTSREGLLLVMICTWSSVSTSLWSEWRDVLRRMNRSRLKVEAKQIKGNEWSNDFWDFYRRPQ
jgi:hypothetical protein